MFYKQVDTRSRKAMVDYLIKHYRYNTMNTWNGETAYANNLKIYNLDLKYPDMAYELLGIQEFQEEIRMLLQDWGDEQYNLLRAGFNGRSGGYLVMYHSRLEPSGYKSFCNNCGQLNYKTVDKSDKCGRCGENRRTNFAKPHMRIVTYPGRGIDHNEDFSDWDMGSLIDRVSLVQSFDLLCDDIVALTEEYCEKYEVVEKEICVPKKIKVLQAV